MTVRPDGEASAAWVGLPLVCPDCSAPLTVWPERFDCPSGHSFPVVGGIPRFAAAESYAQPFGFEWTRHRATQVDSLSGRNDSRDGFAQKIGLGPAELRGRLVLDVGVGSGRFGEIAAGYGARLVGIDLTRAVEAAAQNLGGSALTAQADLFHLPFAAGTFDVVYSIGVLHHTPDTHAAVRALSTMVKPGGTLAIWVYQRATWYRMADLVRRVTTHMSEGSLYRLCRVLAALDPLYRLPLVGRALRLILPISSQADRDWRVLDTFDWYAPRYQWKHSVPEVVGWFRDLGFESIEVLEFPVSVRGKRPL
jgi:SAM-dependent methyltransferase